MGSPLANVLELIFIAAWFVGVVAWIYTARYFLPMWAVGFRKRDQHVGYWKKTFFGGTTFLVAWGIGVGAAIVAERWTGGWG